MKLRLVIALAVVLALFFGGGLIASADDDVPHCWYVSYTISIGGVKIVKIPKTCVPCMRFCPVLAPAPSSDQKDLGRPVSVTSAG